MTTPEKPARCVGGTYLDRMREAIEFAEDSRVRVRELTNEITAVAAQELCARHRQLGKPEPTRVQIMTAADAACGRDNRWSLAVQDEQWGTRLTQMYAEAELVTTLREATQVLKSIFFEIKTTNDLAHRQLEAQQTTNELLRMLVTRSTVPVNLPDPPAPAQRVGD